MGSIHEVMAAFREAPSNSERGTKFEKLMVRYFELDPMLSQQYDAVWRWIDWPGRQGKPDTGIDLVARERDSGEYTAIQCKFYEPTHTLRKEDIDSFFTASGKKPFTNRIIISTTDRWGRNAEDTLDDQTIQVQRIGLAEIADSPIDWDVSLVDGEVEVHLAEATRHEPKQHQTTAIEKVFDGFGKGHDRGKLIMACGTGKTFTALKIAERTATENAGNARILFCVPSISLLSQTLREWTAQTQLDLRAFAVCSDTKVSRAAEDISSYDVAVPVTTNAEKLVAEMSHRRRAKGLTVVFTTYQSLPVVAQAQRDGVDRFDLVICDEAHRTTGVTLEGADESNFVRVHDSDYIKSARRLYMTATPRIFDESVKTKADEHSAEITSMDDEDKYGPEFHRLSFGQAVERGLLTDYKVLVLTVDEEMVAAPLQTQLAGPDGDLRLDDATKIVGAWNGLAKRAGRTPDGTGFAPGEPPMRRAVAFAKDIATSKKIAELFPRVVDTYRDMLTDSIDDGHDVNTTNLDLGVKVHHVDGTYNALERNRELQWLKAPLPDNECRILTNARCLSEGVDVPALDSVMFLHPRNSVVDVVQSVGRVMRKAEGKDYGYIILPVAVPAGISPSQALTDNRRFKVVWQVLNALRAHDDRFNAMVNSIALNTSAELLATGHGSDQLLGGHVGPTTENPESIGNGESANNTSTGTSDDPASGVADGGGASGKSIAQQMALFSLSEWQEAIYTRIVDKVGTRTYWEDWAKDVADIAAALTARIKALIEGADPTVTAAFAKFHKGLQDNLNDSITRDDAISMLAQHLITAPVFDALFASHEFAAHNPVSKTMQAMVDQLGGAGLEAETEHLEGFYDSVRIRASEVTTADGKQQVIAELYEKFFKVGFAKQAEALGIVYTPVEIVDFILRAADHASREAFGRGLTDDAVHILDPFTGTGTFITRLMQSGLIRPEDLTRKYTSELHANEIMLLAYYIAAVNIETTYHALSKNEYSPFEGIVLTDTFQMTEDDDSMDTEMFPQNNSRIVKQLASPIHIIVGNPPYSVGQTSANDLNSNLKYPTLDRRIASTYAKRSKATSQRTLYDSYLRAFRWATDRIRGHGIVAFVSNGGWIDGNSFDGLRLSLADEYSRVYVYNLRGNTRTAGEQARKEGGQTFGSGSRNTVAILIGIKDPNHSEDCEIRYRNIGDYLSRERKLEIVAEGALETIDWQRIRPNSHGDWINQRNLDFQSWPKIGSKDGVGMRIFAQHSLGVATNRDTWVTNYSSSAVKKNVQHLITSYNAHIDLFSTYIRRLGIPHPDERLVTEYLRDSGGTEDRDIKWTRGLRTDLARGTRISFAPGDIQPSAYRPFQSQWLYFNERLNEVRSKLPLMFPTPRHANFGFVVMSPRETAEFAALAVNQPPDLSFFTTTVQFFSRWTYENAEDGSLDLRAGEVDEDGYLVKDNITDEALKVYEAAIGGQVTKDDVFFYVYGLLHDPGYRAKYTADLKKILPHIPTPETRERFQQLSSAGKTLFALHVDYEYAEPYPVVAQLQPGAGPTDRETWRVTKMKWAKKKDPETGKSVNDVTTLIYNSKVTITGIPEDAERYILGSRSALAWIIDRYQVKTDKASGIVNDPNDWCDEHDNPRYIVDLVAKVTTVAVETMKIVDSLSEDPTG